MACSDLAAMEALAPESNTAVQYEYLVVDSGAIIRGHTFAFHKLAKKLVTCKEIIAEIRDGKSRALLETLPFEIELMDPSDEAMLAVSNFARKTGDFAALSRNDLKVLALSYMLETRVRGSNKHIRKEPVHSDVRDMIEKKKNSSKNVKSTITSTDAAKEQSAAVEKVAMGQEDLFEGADTSVSSLGGCCGLDGVDGNHVHLHTHVAPAKDADAAVPPAPVAKSWAAIALSPRLNAPKSKVNPADFVVGNKAVDASSEDTSALATAGAAPTKTFKDISHILSSSGNASGNNANASKKIQDEDDGSGWISFDNLAIARAKGLTLDGINITSGSTGAGNVDTSSAAAGNSSSSTSGSKQLSLAARNAELMERLKRGARVACITTDFSMQNILIQMGMFVISLDGMIIEKVKQWVLRCMACYHVHYDMDRLFCHRCGANHLSRVACSLDAASGELKLHLKKNYRNELRGTIYSIPKPGQQGRFEGELLLREDQLLQGIWRQKVVKIRKDIRSAFGDELTSDVGLHINKSQNIKVGLGKQNPNAQKGRERRGKRK